MISNKDDYSKYDKGLNLLEVIKNSIKEMRKIFSLETKEDRFIFKAIIILSFTIIIPTIPREDAVRVMLNIALLLIFL